MKAEAVTYHFSRMYHVAGLVYGVPILLAFMALRENKTPAAFLILLPMLLVWGGWKAFSALMQMSGESVLMGTVVISILTGFTTVWLLGERVGNRHRAATFFGAAGILLASCALMLVEIGTPAYRLQIGLVVAFYLLILLVGFVIAGFLSRKQFGPVRFSLWLALGVLLATSCVFGILLTIQMFMYFSVYLLWIYVIVVSFSTAVLWGGMLPFLVLFFVNDFWRHRFSAVMGLGGKTLPAAIPPASPCDISEEL